MEFLLIYTLIGIAYTMVIHMYDDELKSIVAEAVNDTNKLIASWLTCIVLAFIWPVSLTMRYLLSKRFWADVRNYIWKYIE